MYAEHETACCACDAIRTPNVALSIVETDGVRGLLTNRTTTANKNTRNSKVTLKEKKNELENVTWRSL
jgi:hypothetical protein